MYVGLVNTNFKVANEHMPSKQHENKALAVELLGNNLKFICSGTRLVGFQCSGYKDAR
jgi:hypothetical protein